MRSVCFIFENHEPQSIKWYWPKEGYRVNDPYSLYFDIEGMIGSYKKRRSSIYFPLNDLLLELVEKHDSKFSFLLSGNFLDRCLEDPELKKSMARLTGTGNIELLGGPYYNNLSCFIEPQAEFLKNVQIHKSLIIENFFTEPVTFVNSALIYNERIGSSIFRMGFRNAIIKDDMLDSRFCYRTGSGIKAMPVHMKLSSDIYRVTDRKWECYPLDSEKYASWIASMHGDNVTLFVNTASLMLDKNIEFYKFFKKLPGALNKCGVDMINPRDHKEDELDRRDFFTTISILPVENILGNHMQHIYYRQLRGMENIIKKCPAIYPDIWNRLQDIDILKDMYAPVPGYAHERAVSNILMASDLKRRAMEAMR